MRAFGQDSGLSEDMELRIFSHLDEALVACRISASSRLASSWIADDKLIAPMRSLHAAPYH